LPGFFIAVFLNPTKAPNHTFGTDSMQNTKSKTSIVGIGTAADDCSNQFAKLIIRNITNMKQGKAIDVSIAQSNQSVPWSIL
jgi:hypothetical protein